MIVRICVYKICGSQSHRVGTVCIASAANIGACGNRKFTFGKLDIILAQSDTIRNGNIKPADLLLLSIIGQFSGVSCNRYIDSRPFTDNTVNMPSTALLI